MFSTKHVGKEGPPPEIRPLFGGTFSGRLRARAKLMMIELPPLFLPLPSWLPVQFNPKEQQQRGHTRKEHVLSQSGSFSRMQKGDPVRGNGKK